MLIMLRLLAVVLFAEGVFSFFDLNPSAQAEPWLGNRFAQNCSGCHAPARKNLAPIDRRCTLSCQGCHVNPNGGGMRSFYGRWNQNRWLRSFRVKQARETKTVAPYKMQIYGKQKYFPKSTKKDRWIYDEGLPLIEREPDYVGEGPYKWDEYATAKNWKEFLYQVPMGDPYRQFDYSRVDAGGDLRWLWAQLQSESNDNEEVADSGIEWMNFMMGFDMGVRYRPIHRYLHLVYEGRMMGSPVEGQQFRDAASTAGTRSLYAMVDNLPFNTFVMGGWYRPLIGSSGPDHNLLSQRMLASAITGSPRAQSMLFNAVSVGAAPNVPFANLHYINRRKTIGGDIEGDRTEGFAVNMGLRFVTLGGAVNYTYWKTKDTNKISQETTDTEIYTIGISGTLGRLTLGLEGMSLARDQRDTDFRRGGVYQLVSRTRIWREYYLVGHYAMANVAETLLSGSGNQIKFGFRGFHIAGVETMLTYDISEQTTDGDKGEPVNTRKTSYLTGQLHVYF